MFDDIRFRFRARKTGWWVACCGLCALIVACGGGGGEVPAEESAEAAVETASEPLVIYSGRNKSLVEPILQRFEEQSGVELEVRYGGTAELAATLLEEGKRTPSDVFIGQDAGALGSLEKAGLLSPISEEILARVPPAFRSPKGGWVGLSGRARVVVYNTERIQPEELPQQLDEVLDPKYRGRFGVAPPNASFQAHMAVYRAVRGDQALMDFLAGLVANEAKTYSKNSAIVEAVLQGEIDWGLTNHYYLWRAKKEQPDAPGANFFMPGDEVSRFINLAGAALLSDRPEAMQLIEFLLSDEAQNYFASETYEYPLVTGMHPAVDLLPLPEIGDQLDFARVSDSLEPTLEAIGVSGLL